MADLSDTPAGMIARLNVSIERRGQTVSITTLGGTPVTVSAKAHVRPVKAEKMVGPIQQTWSKVILSPTGLSSVLPLLKGYTVTIDGRERQIERYDPIKSGNTLVRIELMVAG